MSVDIEAIRREIAIKLNVLVRQDDPVFMAVVINEVMFEHYLKASTEEFVKLLAEHRKEADAANKQALDNSKVVAGRLITEASEYMAKEWKKAVKEASIEEQAWRISVAEQSKDDSTIDLPLRIAAAFTAGVLAVMIVQLIAAYAFP